MITDNDKCSHRWVFVGDSDDWYEYRCIHCKQTTVQYKLTDGYNYND